MLYKHRGIITALIGVLLLFLPPAPFEFAGIPFFAAAFFLRLWARMHIGEHSRGSEIACPEIAKTGPYKYIKHPLYLSNFLAGMAFALFHAGFSLATLGFCTVYGGFLVFLAHNETVFLRGQAQRIAPTAPRSPFSASLKNDLPTWLWQIAMLALIFLRK
jgi:protein-S-isoprenylcysteine O-methyltransferase Ste14